MIEKQEKTLNNMLVAILSWLLITIVSPIQATSTTSNSTLFIDYHCSNKGNYTLNSLYQYSLYNLLGNLSSQASRSGFYEGSYGEIPQQAFALYMCRGDLENQACSECVNAAKDYILRKCPYQTEALIYYDQCKLRFSNESFFGKMEVSPRSVGANKENVTGNGTLFKEIMVETLNELAIEAANGGDQRKFAKGVRGLSGSSKSFYATAQCVPDLTAKDCHRCLKDGIEHLPVSQGARVVMPSCCVRYELHPFFDRITKGSMGPVAMPSQPGERKHTLRDVILSICIISSFILCIGIWMYTKYKRRTVERFKVAMNEIRTAESLEFDLNSIKEATNNFSPRNKIGEGGFGEVYKGLLKGQEVAVKRLTETSAQGIEEFRNEVVLVAKLQHKNLIKLLGFCLDSKEKLLIYEFLHNLSLDHFLFDETKKLSLNWEVRYKLIAGIARGLLYLHEDSRLKIIHRDLKPSNILLDEHMNPKISDFGLARLFGADQTQGDTGRIVGTYGYMAPEYALAGHFSVKSDVYSFGIIMLEIVTGQKNKLFGRPQEEEALIHRAWRLWNEEKWSDLIDETLENKYQREEVTKCIHIGLLCIQEKAIERPSMATIVATLNGQSIILPSPKSPSFMGNIATHEIDHLIFDKESSTKRKYVDSDTITTLYPR